MNKKIIILASFLTLMILPIGALAAGPASVDLLSAGNFAVVSKSGISTTGATSITGNIGVSPINASAITGFGLVADATNVFSTSSLVTGKVYAADYAPPTPAAMTAAVSDMQTAYIDAAGRTNPTATELGAGNIGGMTLVPGLYKWSTGVIIPTDVTLSGSANDVWIFQIAQTLDISSGAKVILAGGAQAGNIFWQVAGQTTLGTTSVFNGNILDQTAIVLNTGSQLNGRALAQTAVTLDSNVVIVASSSVATPLPSPTPSPTPTPNPTPAPSPTPSGSGQATTFPNPSSVAYGPNPALSGSSAADLQAQLLGLQATLQTLKAQQNLSTSSAFGQQVKIIAVNLGRGSNGGDVKILQEFLIAQNKGSAARALANVGATSHFGVLTRAALVEFQASVGISPALGNFGPITRNYISTNY